MKNKSNLFFDNVCFEMERISNTGKYIGLSAAVLFAELEAFFPDYNYYFIGRDMEYYFYISEFLSEKLFKRCHLLNISRASMYSPLLKDYCLSKGILERPAVLIDSGFAGSVIEHIQNIINEVNLPLVLIRSENHNIIQFNAVQKTLDIDIEESVISKKRKIENGLEYLPHVNSKVTEYAKNADDVEEIWSVNPEYAKKYYVLIQEQKDFWEIDNNRLCFEKIRSVFIQFIHLLKPRYDRTEIVLDFDSIINEKIRRYKSMHLLACGDSLYTVPIGFEGFLLYLKKMSDSGNMNLSIYSENNVSLLYDCLQCGRLNEVALRSMNWKIVDPKKQSKRENMIFFPTEDISNQTAYHFQHDYSKILEYMEDRKLPFSEEKHIDVAVIDILKWSIGKSFLLDILSNRSMLDPYIMLDEERVGQVWKLLLDNTYDADIKKGKMYE